MTNTSTLQTIQNKIKSAEIVAKRTNGSCRLIGASKTQSASTLRAFHAAGLANFGENYLNEAMEKQAQLHDLNIIWHYIGSIQSNKTQTIAKHFDWVHTVDRLKIATRLNQHRQDSSAQSPLKVLLQVNIDDEPSKGGVAIDALRPLAEEVMQLPHLRLRGLMAIPKARRQFDEQLAVHQQLLTLKTQLEQQLNQPLDSISAGMSGDLKAAVMAGSTMIRIGTDLFGQRV